MQLQLSLRVADQLHETLLVRGEPLDAVDAVRSLVASPTAPTSLCLDILAVLVSQDRRFMWDGREDGPLSLRHWESPDPDLADVPFVALDLETTGARAGTSKITEIGAVRIEGLQEVAHFGTLVNPMRPIPPIITHITGITQAMVADAPRIEDVIPRLLEFLEGAVVVAHNASFDVGFLNYELQRLRGRRLGEGAIDTLPLARALAPGLPNYRLHTVAAALDAPVTACHRALADAQAAGHVFVTLAGRLRERGITRLSELRAYTNPTSRTVLDKLCLTRDVPKSPGAYRLVDGNGQVLYVGKADRLRERVRAHFVENGDGSRRIRQALRLVERIEWDETCTPLEAVVREQQLILEHRPACNTFGTRPETYAYVRASGTGPGLNLSATSRAPRWLQLGGPPAPHAARSLVIGPFRGRARLNAALDLLQRCYPIRRCPRNPEGRPCFRAEHGRCLAPCKGDPQVRMDHDALVMDIIGWLTGRTDVALTEPQESAGAVIRTLSRQRRYEEAANLRQACDHLLNVKRSYEALCEASRLSFATVWPLAGNGSEPSVRVDLVWNGRLKRALSIAADDLETAIGAVLEELWDSPTPPANGTAAGLVAVPQCELDTLLAVRHWFYETERTPKVLLPGPDADRAHRGDAQARLVAEARGALATIVP